MGKLIDLTGKRFGRLVAVERVKDRISPNGSRHTRWLCQCDCGSIAVIDARHLRNGNVVSCGCLRAEKSSKRAATRNGKHGKRYTRLYNIWRQMKARCYNPHHKFYSGYGGRGITICENWLKDFQAFHDWAVSHGYNEYLTIDRIDNDKGYSPDNCRWATQAQQVRNRKGTKKYALNGESKTIAEWCEYYKKDWYKVWDRLHRHGWTIEEALDLVQRKK